ncbi:hypothetical protein CFELI_05625 [Corynebacterium felinum]|nr:hypothetical protein [Corynebacterium felinum]WJY94753.1 hypothetical protein CFELI_05625 [Corynebacterium felinum]
MVACVLLISGCATFSPNTSGNDPDTQPGAAETQSLIRPELKAARNENRKRHVAEEFPDHPIVISDDLAGIEASKHFFDSSETVIVAGPHPWDQLRAASIAVVSHAPMLSIDRDSRGQVLSEIQRLQSRYILTVGEVDLASTSGSLSVIEDPGTFEALGKLTAFQFERTPVIKPEDIPHALASLDYKKPAILEPSWLPAPAQKTNSGRTHAFPGQSKRDADTAPMVIATTHTSVAAMATARAYGANIRVLEDADPRYNIRSMQAVAGLSDQPLVALGSHFGSNDQLATRIALGERSRGFQPGRGARGTVFPHRLILGTELTQPNSPDTAPTPAHEWLNQQAQHPEMDITPAYFLTAENLPHWDAGSESYGIVTVDGVDTLEKLSTMLERANTGIYATANEEECATWLANFVADKRLPQKLFISKDAVVTNNRQELAFVGLVEEHNYSTIEHKPLPAHYYAGLVLSEKTQLTADDIEKLSPRPWLIKVA